MNNSSGLLWKSMNLKREKISNHWMTTVNKYLRRLRMSWNTLRDSNKDNIKKEVMKLGKSQ